MLSDEIITAPADVLIIPMTEDISKAVETATKLREQGIRTQLYSENKKFKAKMSYADKISVPFVVFIGDDEIKEGVIKVKDMRSGEQLAEEAEAAALRIKATIDNQNRKPVIKE